MQMSKIKKILYRLYRMFIYREKVFGKVGDNNVYKWNCLIFENAIIGNNNYIGANVEISNAQIGNYCSIAKNAIIGPSSHSLDFITTYQKISGDMIKHSLYGEKAIVGSDVWCGANVVVLQGVKVGTGVVIGANSVVTKDIPDYAIVGGIPAKLIRYRFPEKKRKILIESNWYNFNLKEAKEIIGKIAELEINQKD